MVGTNLKWFALFFIVLIVNLTPACAVQMEDVAHEAEKYNIDSKKKMGFFAKAKFMAQGFQLLKKAEKASKETKHPKVEDVDEYQELWNQHTFNEKQQQKLLKYRNRETINNNTTNNNTFVVPEECHTQIQNLIQLLHIEGIECSETTQDTIDTGLKGKIVQIIDEKGYLRYALVKSMESDKIVLSTSSNNEKTMSLDEFQKAYTHKILKTEQTQTSYQVLDYILNKEKNNLNQEEYNAQYLHDKARAQTGIGGLQTGLGATLLIIGILLTLFYGSQLIKAAQQLPEYTAQFTSPEAEQKYLEIHNTKGRTPITHDAALEGIIRAVGDTNVYMSEAAANAVIIEYATRGVEVVALTSLQIALQVAVQNWVQVIILMVGLILALVGITLIVTGIYKTYLNGTRWYRVNRVSNRNKKDFNNLEAWLEPHTPNVTTNTINKT